jgi:type II secretory pathway predicted ATPase ExeA
VGDIGAGKTLALRVLLDELSGDKYKVAFLTNPTLTFTQIMREIIGQLENRRIDTKWKDHLQEEFNQLLYRSADEGKRVVVFIDEANVLRASSLEGLRLLTNIQDNNRNLVTFVLAGQKELARKLERSSRENLYQRIGVYCKVTGLDSQAMVAGYIAHRLGQAGCTQEVFTEPSIRAIWRYSRGVPRMVNRICKLCLKAGETNQLQTIDEAVVDSLAYMFEKGFFKEKGTARKKETTSVEAAEADAGREPTEEVLDGKEDAEAVPTPQPATPPVVATVKEREVPSSDLRAAEPSRHTADREGAPLSRENEPAPMADAKKFEVVTQGEKPVVAVADHREAARHEEQEQEGLEGVIKRVPPEILDRLCFMEDRELYRLAGQLAAGHLRENEDLKNSGDPILHWEKMRSEIMVALKELSVLRQVRQTSQYR